MGASPGAAEGRHPRHGPRRDGWHDLTPLGTHARDGPAAQRCARSDDAGRMQPHTRRSQASEPEMPNDPSSTRRRVTCQQKWRQHPTRRVSMREPPATARGQVTTTPTMASRHVCRFSGGGVLEPGHVECISAEPASSCRRQADAAACAYL